MDGHLREKPRHLDPGAFPGDTVVLLRRAYVWPMAGTIATASGRRNHTRAAWTSIELHGHGRTRLFACVRRRRGECVRRGTRALLRLSDHDFAPVQGVWIGADWLFHVRAVKHRRRTSAVASRRVFHPLRHA